MFENLSAGLWPLCFLLWSVSLTYVLLLFHLVSSPYNTRSNHSSRSSPSWNKSQTFWRSSLHGREVSICLVERRRCHCHGRILISNEILYLARVLWYGYYLCSSLHSILLTRYSFLQFIYYLTFLQLAESPLRIALSHSLPQCNCCCDYGRKVKLSSCPYAFPWGYSLHFLVSCLVLTNVKL